MSKAYRISLAVLMVWIVGHFAGRRGRPVNNVDEDEQLAKAMQESLNFEYRDPRRTSNYPSMPAPPPRYA